MNNKKKDNNSYGIAGIECRLMWGEYRVEKFGNAPHVAVWVIVGEDAIASWMPQAVWDSAVAEANAPGAETQDATLTKKISR